MARFTMALVLGAVMSGCASEGASRFDGEMVRIAPGEFWAGDLSGEGRPDERPARRLRMERSFWVSKFEVTNAQYAAFVAATGRAAPAHWGGDACPEKLAQHAVTHVSWADANAFCEWAGVRLLTEAEWEYVARGTTEWAYPFGDMFFPKLANTRHEDGVQHAPVGSCPDGASPHGVHDMAGGVWEWVADRYDDRRWKRVEDGPVPAACDEGLGRVLKGGAWTLEPKLARVSARDRTSEHAKGLMIGFRVARDA